MIQCKTKNLYLEKKLGDLILFLRNGINNDQVDTYTDFPVTRIETIADGIIDYNRVGYVTKALEDYKILQGDILVSNINSQKHIGKVAIKNDDKVLYHGMNLLLMRPNKTIDQKFLFYLLHYNKHYFERIANSAVNQSSINQTDMQKMEFIIPLDTEEQQRIANILSICDEVIEKTEEAIEKHKHIKAGMMQDLFTRGLDENGKLRPTYDEVPDLYKYSEELDRYIPKEWDVKPLEEYITLIKDGTHGTHKDIPNGIPLLSAKDIQDGEVIIPIDCRTISQRDYNSIHRSYNIDVNDVLLTIVGTIGRVSIVKSIEKLFTFQRSVAIIKLINPEIAGYFYYYLLYENTQKQLLAMMNASAQGGLYLGQLANIIIAMPKDEEEIKNIFNYLNQMDLKIKLEKQYLSKYKQIKQGLMKKLLTPPPDAKIVEE